MQGTVSKYCVALKRKQRKWLERVVRRRTPSHWLVQRARAILLGAEGQSIQSICQQLSMDRQVVRRWRKRFLIGGVHSLKDRPRPGRPPVIGAKVWQKVATVVVQPPTKFDLELPRWSLRELSLFLSKRFGWKVSRSSLSRFLRSMALKPHRIKYWLNPTDPDFDQKAAVICKLYLGSTASHRAAQRRREAGGAGPVSEASDDPDGPRTTSPRRVRVQAPWDTQRLRGLQLSARDRCWSKSLPTARCRG